MSNYLAHHGILGMKWGVRRFQNPDGSLTAAGQKRYAKAEKTAKTAKKINDEMFSQNIKVGKDKSPISPAEQIAKKSSQAIDGAKDIAKSAENIRRTKKDNKEDISSMSDEELKKKIQRLELEQRYDNLSPKDTSKGYEYVSNILTIAGGVTTIAASAVGIWATIHKLKNGG